MPCWGRNRWVKMPHTPRAPHSVSNLTRNLPEGFPAHPAGDRPAASAPSTFPPVYGGAVGYFGYDVARWFERLPHPPPDDLGLPDLELAFLDLVAVVDHHQKELWLIFCPFGERFIKESREELYEE